MAKQDAEQRDINNKEKIIRLEKKCMELEEDNFKL